MNQETGHHLRMDKQSIEMSRFTTTRLSVLKVELLQLEDLKSTHTAKQYYRFQSDDDVRHSREHHYLCATTFGTLGSTFAAENVYDHSSLFEVTGKDVALISIQNARKIVCCHLCDTMHDPHIHRYCSILRHPLLSKQRRPCAHGAACRYKLKCTFRHCENDIVRWLALEGTSAHQLVRDQQGIISQIPCGLI